jgi:hypothetical protein
MSEPGLDLHGWQTRWEELESQFETDAAGTLPDAADLIDETLAGDDLAGAVSDDMVASVRAAREVADRIERGEDVDPGDVGQAIDDLRAVQRTLTAADTG